MFYKAISALDYKVRTLVSPPTLQALRLNRTARFLLRIKTDTDGSDQNSALRFAKCLMHYINEEIESALELGAGTKLETHLNVVCVQGRSGRFYVCWDIFLTGCCQVKRAEILKSLSQPIHYIKEACSTFYVYRHQIADKIVANHYKWICNKKKESGVYHWYLPRTDNLETLNYKRTGAAFSALTGEFVKRIEDGSRGNSIISDESTPLLSISRPTQVSCSNQPQESAKQYEFSQSQDLESMMSNAFDSPSSSLPPIPKSSSSSPALAQGPTPAETISTKSRASNDASAKYTKNEGQARQAKTASVKRSSDNACRRLVQEQWSWRLRKIQPAKLFLGRFQNRLA